VSRIYSQNLAIFVKHSIYLWKRSKLRFS